MNDIEKLFQSPSADYRGKPFWSWNGKLDKEELLRQIEFFRQMGMGGYFCHSRIGLITEYLGDEWFELINACADKGQELGMETWLYDEDRWPSGIAGGIVTADPANSMKFIRLSIQNGDDFVYSDDIVAAFTVQLDGFSFTNKTRINQDTNVNGKKVLKFTVEVILKQTFCNGFTYVDTMKKTATDKFIEVTHEKYKEKCGDKFGHSIKGIFTDEPHRGAVMCGFGNPNKDSEYLTPYTDLLFEDFIRAYGYDLRDYLPELFLWKDGEKVSPVKWQYMELTQQLFLDNFLSPINSWCTQNGIQFTGHVLHEDSLTAQTCMQGSVMRSYEYFDIPGVDVLTEHNYNFWIVKQLQSAARQLGKKGMMSELYGCTGWQFTFENHKAVGDWQALFGINLRCHHLSWYGMQGEAKRDYPATISYQSAWYKQYHYIEDYFSRLNVLMSQGEPACDLLVVYPVESVWCRIYPRWSWMLGIDDADIQKTERIFADTFRLLCNAKLDFDYGDEDFLKRMGSTEIINGEPFIRVGNSRYRSVLVTGMLTMRQTTLDLLNRFVQIVGNVVFGGDAPEFIDAVPSRKAFETEADYTDFEDILEHLKVMPLVTVKDENDRTVDDIFVQVRKENDNYIAVLMNINRSQAFQNVTVTLDMEGFCEEWDAKTGERYLLEKGKPITFRTDFEPVAELCLVITKQNNDLKQKKQPVLTTKDISMGNSFAYRLHEPNVCVLDFVDYKIDTDNWVENKEILKADREIRTKLNIPLRGGGMLQPWFVGKIEKLELCNLKLRCSFNIQAIPDKLNLAVESADEYQIFINGHANSIIKTQDHWVDHCFQVLEINKEALKIGENTVTMSCRFRSDINLEAIYLLGSFGVTLDKQRATLCKMPEMLTLGDVSKQGFPFYGAGISYYLNILSELNGAIQLHTQSFEAACIIITNGENEKVVFSKPYKADITSLINSTSQIEMQYILTRRNTFGPLHFAPLIAGGYGPETFLGDGELFLNDSYGLLPQGMVSEVFLTAFDENVGL